MKRALILVDLQNDFLPGGALAVPAGDEVLPVAKNLMDKRQGLFDLVIATQDFHPAHHKSFAVNNPGKKIGDMAQLGGLPQVMWPSHCVQGQVGADFAKSLDISKVDQVFKKGMDPMIDSYSGFYDNGQKQSTGLAEFLKKENVTELVVLGLATDYCVKFTVLDALRLGFTTTLLTDGSRGVNLQPEDSATAVADMKKAGAQVMTSPEFLGIYR